MVYKSDKKVALRHKLFFCRTQPFYSNTVKHINIRDGGDTNCKSGILKVMNDILPGLVRPVKPGK